MPEVGLCRILALPGAGEEQELLAHAQSLSSRCAYLAPFFQLAKACKPLNNEPFLNLEPNIMPDVLATGRLAYLENDKPESIPILATMLRPPPNRVKDGSQLRSSGATRCCCLGLRRVPGLLELKAAKTSAVPISYASHTLLRRLQLTSACRVLFESFFPTLVGEPSHLEGSLAELAA